MSQPAAILVPEAGPKSPVEMAQAINGSIRAILSQHSGAARPAYVVPGMKWIKNDVTPWAVMIYDGANDVPIGTIDPTSHAFQVTLRGLEPEVDVASAATADLGAANSAVVRITGTTQISSFGPGKNMFRLVRFAGALTLKNGAGLALPGAADIATAVGDTATVLSDNAGNWRVVTYQRADGSIVTTRALTSSFDRISNTRGTLFSRGATDLVGIPPGAAGLPLLSAGPGAEPYYGAVPSFRLPDLWVHCERAQGSNDTPLYLTVGAYIARALNTVKRNVITGASLFSNQITLPVGTYYARWRAPALSSGGTNVAYNVRSKLYNVTAAGNIELSFTAYAFVGSNAAMEMTTTGEAVFTLGATSVLELRHIAGTGTSSTGSALNGTGEIEIYSSVEIWKVG